MGDIIWEVLACVVCCWSSLFLLEKCSDFMHMSFFPNSGVMYTQKTNLALAVQGRVNMIFTQVFRRRKKALNVRKGVY